MSARHLLLRIQRALYDKLAKHSVDLLGPVPKPLANYAKIYEREFTSFQRISSSSELLEVFLQADVAFWGDYHTLPQAQNTLLLTARLSQTELKKRGRRVVLALEMLRPRDELGVKKYLAGRLSEAALLKQIGYMRNWGFPWENYRPLLEFAGTEAWEIRGLATGERGLKARDRSAAQIIAGLANAPDRPLVIVLMGDHHLASPHLPRELSRALGDSNLRTLKVLQNIDSFYWKLLTQGRIQGVEVVKLSAGTFCLLSAPPWVKLQSHLNWNEVCSQMGESKKSIAPLKRIESALREMDHSEEFQDYVESLAEALGTSLDSEDFMLYGPGELSFLNRMSGGWSARNLANLQKYLRTFKSFYVPKENIIYYRSFNHGQLATQAAFYVHSKLGGYDRIFGDAKQDLFRFAWIEAMGFLGSKLLNSKRRCPNRAELISLAELGPPADRKIAATVLNILDDKKRVISTRGPVSAYKVSKLLGHRLGERLYHAVMHERLPIVSVRQLFSRNFLELSPKAAEAEYRLWEGKLAEVP